MDEDSFSLKQYLINKATSKEEEMRELEYHHFSIFNELRDLGNDHQPLLSQIDSQTLHVS